MWIVVQSPMLIQFRKRCVLWLPAVLLACLWAVPAHADWINLSGAEVAPNIAEVYVLDDRVKLVLEVYVGDLRAFEALIPDDWLKGKVVSRPPVAERMRWFAERTLQVIGPDGKRLPARLELVEPRLRVDRRSPFAGMINPYTRQQVPEAPADKRVLYAEISYPFEGRPVELTFVPPLDAEKRPAVSLGFIAYHKSVPVIDFRYLSAPARLALEWRDPWYSKFANPNLNRHHKDALMSFLYVEPYEVRHEILVRARDMADWMDLGLRGDEYIEVDELEALKQRIGAFLLRKNPVRVDGRALTPILDRTNYVKVGLTGIQILEAPERLEISSAIIGVILTYITEGMPNEVTVDWELFTDEIRRVPATAIDPAGPLLSILEPQDSVHTWTNHLKNYTIPTVAAAAVAGTLPPISVPVGTAVCVLALIPLGWIDHRRRRGGDSTRGLLALGAALLVAGVGLFPYARVAVARPALLPPALDEARAQAILQGLLRNVYRSFDFRKESDVYDKLATSVAGDLLADVYLQSRRSLLIEQAGGAQARLQDVEILEAVPEGPLDRRLAYDVRAKWTASGTVGHWGHVHLRKNLYEADLRIEGTAGVWKLTRVQLRDERRIDPAAQQALAGGASRARAR